MPEMQQRPDPQERAAESKLFAHSSTATWSTRSCHHLRTHPLGKPDQIAILALRHALEPPFQRRHVAKLALAQCQPRAKGWPGRLVAFCKGLLAASRPHQGGDAYRTGGFHGLRLPGKPTRNRHRFVMVTVFDTQQAQARHQIIHRVLHAQNFCRMLLMVFLKVWPKVASTWNTLDQMFERWRMSANNAGSSLFSLSLLSDSRTALLASRACLTMPSWTMSIVLLVPSWNPLLMPVISMFLQFFQDIQGRFKGRSLIAQRLECRGRQGA
ncbi:hypothetical protein WR25_16525 [Diploscapter pachys]|uniref:Uncharacterized protein n=1 Tax=Diploscapter pachys TaxID=2018661 RepID=A0A2A2KJE5_9BILA|nr:hypothetical protein WR25_16525 [Diploscapter pachys]